MLLELYDFSAKRMLGEQERCFQMKKTHSCQINYAVEKANGCFNEVEGEPVEYAPCRGSPSTQEEGTGR